MKNQLIKLLSLFLLATATLSCEKDYGDDIAPLDPSYADTPVTVTNFDVFERFPVVFATAPAGAFAITLSIPADKGTIKEITRVATGTLANLQNASASFALNGNGTSVTPIAGNGTNTITFNSTLAAYTAYRTRIGAGAGLAATVSTTPQAPTQISYFFVLTLSTPAGEVRVIPTQVRVRVI